MSSQHATNPVDPAAGWRLPPWWRYPAAGAAVLVLALLGGLLALGLSGRSSGPAFSVSVVPPPADTQAASGSASGAAVSAPQTADARAASGVQSAAPPGAAPGQSIALPYPGPIVATACSASPTVQFQGRGLAATGVAPVKAAQPVGTVSVTISQTGTDAATAVGGVQSKIAALREALAKVGVAASDVQVSYFSAYGDPLRRTFTAYASLSATVTGTDALAAATDAVLQVPGVTAYSTSSPIAGRPSQQEVQDAVGQAAGQARQMAASTAAAAGVQLGSVQSVVAQPPVVCYGSAGPERVVQVTVMYAIR